jgi:hypothetical protein
MNIGQKVVIKNISGEQTFGVYAGSSLVQRHDEGSIEQMAIVRLDPEYSGYIHPTSGKPANSYINFVVVHPDNLIEA